MNNFTEIKLPDISKDQIIEIRDYEGPNGSFYIHYVSYKNGILLTNIRGLSQLSDVIAYFALRDEMVKKAGYTEYVEIRDNSGGANTTREGRSEIVRYYGQLDTSCKALIFANASMLVHLQVKIGKRIINNKHLFTTTTSTLEEGFELANNILQNRNYSLKNLQQDSVDSCFKRCIYPIVKFIKGNRKSRVIKIKETDILNVFNLIQKINFNFDDLIELPKTDNKEINLIYDSLLLLRSDTNIYMTKLNEKITELEEETKRRKAVEQDLTDQNILLQNAFKDLQQTQDIIIKQEKLASLGTMVAGIAHEINNPTQAIRFAIESLDLNLKDIKTFLNETIELLDLPEEDKNEKLEKIKSMVSFLDINTIVEEIDTFVVSNLQSIKRIEHIVNSSKRMAYSESFFSACNINLIIEDALTLVANQIKYSATVKKQFGKSIPYFNGLAQELGQVFINMLINAKDAIEEKGLTPEKGIISIETMYHAERENIEIRISDNGKGMKPEHIAKIYDPFFTTKAIGKGTGLGLNLVHRIIESHNGHIHVESVPGEGTDFIIHLPIPVAKKTTIN